MDYNKIKTFLVVSEQKNITIAAQKLGRTQSAITQQIKLLEEDLGFQLFERKHAKIFLTREGTQLFKIAKNSLDKLDQDYLTLKNDLKSIEGTIKIGLEADYGEDFLCDHIINFKKIYPKVNFHILLGKSREIEEKLINNEIDIGLLINFKEKSFFDIVQHRKDEHIVVTSPAYLKKNGPLIDYKQIINSNIFDSSNDFNCFSIWIKKNQSSLLKELELKTPDIVSESHFFLKTILLSGAGVAILPKFLIQKELDKKSLIQLMPESKPVYAILDIAIRKKRNDRFVDALFLKHLKI